MAPAGRDHPLIPLPLGIIAARKAGGRATVFARPPCRRHGIPGGALRGARPDLIFARDFVELARYVKRDYSAGKSATMHRSRLQMVGMHVKRRPHLHAPVLAWRVARGASIRRIDELKATRCEALRCAAKWSAAVAFVDQADEPVLIHRRRK